MFYDYFVKLCAERGESMSAAAESAGFSKGTVSIWKKKTAAGEDFMPSPDVLQKLSVHFGVPVSDLLNGGPAEDPENGQKKETATGVSSSGLSELQLSTIQMVSQMDHDTLAKFNAMMKAYLGI